MTVNAELKNKSTKVLLFVFVSVFAAMQSLSVQPNIVMIVVDDMDGTVPGVFGGVFAPDVTPNIDQLAREGMRFEKAHVTVAVCQPSRQTIMTGKVPPRIGAMGFTDIDDDVITLGELLDQAGYINGTYNKLLHCAPTSKYNWSYTKNGTGASEGRSPVRTRQMTEEFIDIADDAGKPFFLMANTTDPHLPFCGSADELSKWPKAYDSLADGGMEFSIPSKLFTTNDITLPPSLVNVWDSRRDLTRLEVVAQYVNSCRRADDIIGEILNVIDEKGKRDNTIVLFLSDNGMPFEGAKFETYFQSTKTPLIVRWPDHIPTNTVNDTHYVSGIDLMPTILDAAGITIPSDLDGSSFLPLLEGETVPVGDRDKVVTAHFEHVIYLSAGTTRDRYINERGYVEYSSNEITKPQNLRCVQSGDYGYIFNANDTGFDAVGPSMTTNVMAGLDADDWWDHRLDFLDNRGPEEFYNFSIDPHGLNNLIDDPAYAGIIAEFRYKLRDWMEEINDPNQYEYQHLIDGTTPEMYLKFANLVDGQNIQSSNSVASNVELEYVILEYIEVMTLLVDGASHEERVRAPFVFDISTLSAGEHTLRLQMEDKLGNFTYSDPITITIDGDIVVPPDPAVEFANLSDGEIIPLGEDLNITGILTGVSPAEMRFVYLRLDNAVHSTDWDVPYTFNVTGLSEGSHRLILYSRYVEDNPDGSARWIGSDPIDITVSNIPQHYAFNISSDLPALSYEISTHDNPVFDVDSATAAIHNMTIQRLDAMGMSSFSGGQSFLSHYRLSIESIVLRNGSSNTVDLTTLGADGIRLNLVAFSNDVPSVNLYEEDFLFSEANTTILHGYDYLTFNLTTPVEILRGQQVALTTWYMNDQGENNLDLGFMRTGIDNASVYPDGCSYYTYYTGSNDVTASSIYPLVFPMSSAPQTGRDLAFGITGTRTATGFDAWMEAADYPIDQSAPDDDLDGDGDSNFHEYAFGGNVNDSGIKAPRPFLKILNDGGVNNLAFIYSMRTDTNGLTYVIETTESLTNTVWDPVALNIIGSKKQGPDFFVTTNAIPMDTAHKYYRVRAGQE